MTTEEKEVWLRVYCSYVNGRNGEAYDFRNARWLADQAVRDFNNKFPNKTYNSE